MNGKMRIWILSCIVFSVILLGIGSATHAEAASADTSYYYGVVKEGPLNVRSGPGVTYASLGKIAIGTKVTVSAISTVNNVQWYRITFQSKTGYICGKYVQTFASQTLFSTAKTATVIQGPLNVRSGPATGYLLLGSIEPQKSIQVLGVYYKYGTEKWYRIIWNDKLAYISASYVALNTSGCTVTKYPANKYGVMNTTAYVRTGPGAEHSAVAQAILGKSGYFIGEITNPLGEKWYLFMYSYAICYIPSDSVTLTSVPTSANAQKIVNLALSKVGCAYVYGTEGPNTFDCSGFVYWVVNNSGIPGLSVPRTSDDLYYKYKAYNIGTSIANAKPGDIILFSTNGTASGISHSAIYYKDSTIIHASTPETGVIITSVAYSTTNKSVFAIIRLPGL